MHCPPVSSQLAQLTTVIPAGRLMVRKYFFARIASNLEVKNIGCSYFPFQAETACRSLNSAVNCRNQRGHLTAAS